MKLSGLVRCRMGRNLPVATPRLGQRRQTQTAKLGCNKMLRVSCDPLGKGSRICNVDFVTLICHSEPVLTLAWESQSTVLNVEIATTSLRTGFAMTTNWGTLHIWGLLVAEPAFAFAGTRSRSVTVRSGRYEPPSCQYGG